MDYSTRLPVLSKIAKRLHRLYDAHLKKNYDHIYSSPTPLKVFILTYCKYKNQLYGSTLIFKTLRVGFPTAQVTVIDNASIPEARVEIECQAKNNNATFIHLEHEISHHQYLQEIVSQEKLRGTVVFLDPDIVFWESCENWNFKELLAGRLIPTYVGVVSKCITKPRLHTSFWWIQDITKLQRAIQKIHNQYYEFNPFIPYMYQEKEKWYRFDTGANLYAAMEKKCYPFHAKELNCYDHTFEGTHVNLIINDLPGKLGVYIRWLHESAKNDYTLLKHTWKQQDKEFKKFRPKKA